MANKTTPGPRPSKGGRRKLGRNERKCAAYRARVREMNEGQRKHAKLTRGTNRKGAGYTPAVRPATGAQRPAPGLPGFFIYA